MILITSTGESLLYFTVSFSFVSFHWKKKKKLLQDCFFFFFCVVLGCPISTAELHVPVVLIVIKWNPT